MSWATTIRQWWDEIFYSSSKRHLQEEIVYLRNELAQAHIENSKLQIFLNSVTPAGLLLARQQNPTKKSTLPPSPVRKRWADIENERYQELEEIRLKKIAEAQTKTSN